LNPIILLSKQHLGFQRIYDYQQSRDQHECHGFVVKSDLPRNYSV